MQSAWPWGDAQICRFCAVLGATAARQEMSARAGSAACTSCRGCQPGARSSSIPAVRLHRQQGQSPAWGWQLQPRWCWKQIRSWGSRSSLPAGAEPAAPNRSRRRLPLPRAQQTDRRTAPSPCPQGATSFWGKAGRGTGSCSSPPAGEACLVVVTPAGLQAGTGGSRSREMGRDRKAAPAVLHSRGGTLVSPIPLIFYFYLFNFLV